MTENSKKILIYISWLLWPTDTDRKLDEVQEKRKHLLSIQSHSLVIVVLLKTKQWELNDDTFLWNVGIHLKAYTALKIHIIIKQNNFKIYL